MALTIIGDTHSDINKTIKVKIDNVLILGDFGFYWDNSKEEIKMRNKLKNSFEKVYFIDGNHENFDLLHKVFDKTGKDDNIIWLKRGEITEIEGYSFLSIGGAYSIDRNYRILGVSYWEEELPTYMELSKCLNYHNVDYVITHEAPGFILEKLYGNKYNPYYLTKFFDDLYKTLHFTHWFCGHHHIDITIDKCSILWEKQIIIEKE